MAERIVKVECYAGYKSDERPVRVAFGSRAEEVTRIEDRWYSPGETYFRVLLASGDRYILRHVEAQDVWTIAGFRSSQPAQSEAAKRDAKRNGSV